MTPLASYFLLGGSSILFSGGTWMLKHAATTNELKFLFAAFAILAAANLIFMQLLNLDFGRWAISSAMINQLFALTIGVVFYAEPFTQYTIAGSACALCSVWLLSQ